MFKLDKAVKRALELRQQLTAARFGRRELAKLGLIAGGAHYAKGASLREVLAQTVPASKLTPWKDPLPLPPKAQERGGDAYNVKNHQWCDRYPSQDADVYRLRLKEHGHKFHSELPASEVWSYNGSFGGPVLDVRYGTPFSLHFQNELPKGHTGYGTPDTTAHLHNFHTATESDGGPWNMLRPDGGERYQHYTMCRAGFADPLGPGNPHYKDTTGLAALEGNGASWFKEANGRGDLRETLTTLFIHDHRPEFTGPNLYKGLFMMVRVFDGMDTGDETRGWKLPSGEYDVPLMFQDKQIVRDTGEMVYNQFAVDGFLGNYLTVNGAIQPVHEVEPRAYRFRLLDGGPSRFYRFELRTAGKNVKFAQITDNGNLLATPRAGLSNLDLWVGERSDIIVDFTGMADGTEVILSNTLSMRADGRGEEVGKRLNPDDPANQLLKFKVVRKQASYPKFTLPARFRPVPPPPADLAKLPRKLFKLERKNGQWAINGKFWDADSDHADAEQGIPPLYQVKRDTAEIWTLESSSGGWDHPMHIHFEEGQILSRNGVAVPLANRHRYDIYRMRQNRLEVLYRFRDFPQDGYTPADHTNQTDDPGRYVMHCHNVVHEDHSMMATWSIKP